jgi:uncharacterized protein
MIVVYFVLGTVFGIALFKGETVSWFRIQEMFRFQSFYLWGVFMTAVAVAAPSIYLIKRMKARTFAGEPIVIPPKQLGGGYRYWIGGSIFGVGLALAGACPGPLLSLIGGGYSIMLVVFASALAGSWTYGYLRPRLPH